MLQRAVNYLNPKPMDFVHGLCTLVLAAAIGVIGRIAVDKAPGPAPEPIPTPSPTAFITLPDRVQGEVGRIVRIKAETAGDEVQWWTDDPTGTIDFYPEKREVFFSSPTKGDHIILGFTARILNGKVVPTPIQKTIVGIGTTPPGPGPTPGPTPPIPQSGFRVLILFKEADRKSYTPGQIACMTSEKVLSYLRSHCAKVGNAPEYRILDVNTDLSHESDVWKQALARASKDSADDGKAKGKALTLPWLIAGNGETGVSQPLPGNTDEMLRVLQPIGGQ